MCVCVYNSTMKKNEILPFETTWMGLEDFILGEIIQTEKNKYHMILFIKKKKTNQRNKQIKTDTEICIEKGLMVPKGEEVRNMKKKIKTEKLGNAKC